MNTRMATYNGNTKSLEVKSLLKLARQNLIEDPARCAATAITFVDIHSDQSETIRNLARRAIATSMGVSDNIPRSIWDWNDSHTRDEVLTKFNEAIALA